MAILPAFIGGFRSGTTLLINLLGMHPDVSPWFETKEFCEALRYQKVLQDPHSSDFESHLISPAEPMGFTMPAVYQRMLHHMQLTQDKIKGSRKSGKASHERYPIGNDCVNYDLATAESALQMWREALEGDVSLPAITAANAALIKGLANKHCELDGAKGWVNKTPEISRFALQLRASLGPCKVIYLVRNGLHVVASAKKLGWGDASNLAFKWKGLLEQTRQAMEHNEADYLELRYEQLLLDPVKELNKVFACCGYTQSAETIVEQFKQNFGAAAFSAGSSNSTETLEAKDIESFLAVAGDLQSSLGYPLQ